MASVRAIQQPGACAPAAALSRLLLVLVLAAAAGAGVEPGNTIGHTAAARIAALEVDIGRMRELTYTPRHVLLLHHHWRA